MSEACAHLATEAVGLRGTMFHALATALPQLSVVRVVLFISHLPCTTHHAPYRRHHTPHTTRAR
jgi:hypothetical protein